MEFDKTLTPEQQLKREMGVHETMQVAIKVLDLCFALGLRKEEIRGVFLAFGEMAKNKDYF